MRQPRIVLVVPSFPKTSETFIVSKFVGLLERGWDAHVVCNSSSAVEWKRFPELQALGVHDRVHLSPVAEPRWRAVLQAPPAAVSALVNSPAAGGRYLRSAGTSFPRRAIELAVDSRLLKLGADVVHFEFGTMAVERIRVRERLDCRVVVSFRGYDISYAGVDQPSYYEQVWRCADALHFLSEGLHRRALERGCPPELPYTLIPPAIDGEYFRRREPNRAEGSSRPLRLLSVGRLEWVKGYEYALQAVRHLLDSGIDCHYRIVGNGAFFEPLVFACHQLDVTDHVEFVGALPREGVRAQMETADVFVHSAVSEGFCNAVLEAQAMELPVVCSDAGGLPENVVDGETGLVVPRRDATMLADALRRLAVDIGFRRRLGGVGRARVLRDFRLEDQITAFERLYRSVLSPGTPGDPSPNGSAGVVPEAAKGSYVVQD